MKTQVKAITIHGKEWFDRINGNSYHSVRVYVDGIAHALEFDYGYGSMYEQRAGELLKELGVLPSATCLYSQCAKLGINYNCHKDTKQLKRDVVAWGKL